MRSRSTANMSSMHLQSTVQWKLPIYQKKALITREILLMQKNISPELGLEPRTCRLEGGHSIQLSHTGMKYVILRLFLPIYNEWQYPYG
jgi:hypothetical protein